MPNDRETPLLDEIPADLRPQVEGRLEAGEVVELSIASDIKLDGHYDAAWLLATDRRLLALSPNGEGDPHVEEIALAEITTVEIRELSGSGVIKVRTGDRGRTMAVFSKSAIARFSDVPAQLEALIAKARPLVEGEKIIDGRIGSGLDKGTRWEKCGRVIPHRIGICPACLDSGKLLFRLISRALPYRGLVAISLLLVELEEQKEQLDDEAFDVGLEIEATKQKAVSAQSLTESLTTFGDLYREALPEERRELIRLRVNQLIWTPEEIRLALLDQPYQELVESQHLVARTGFEPVLPA